MFCKNCGADIPEGSTFCGNCGMKVTVEPSQQEPINQQYQQPEADPQTQPEEPQQDTYQTYQQVPPQQPQYSQPVYNAQPVQQPADLPNPTLWIILNIVMIVIGCCCSISSIIAIVGLVFAIQGNNAMKAGDMLNAANKLKTAKILFFVSLGVFVAGNIIGFASCIFSSTINGMEDYLYYYGI